MFPASVALAILFAEQAILDVMAHQQLLDVYHFATTVTPRDDETGEPIQGIRYNSDTVNEVKKSHSATANLNQYAHSSRWRDCISIRRYCGRAYRNYIRIRRLCIADDPLDSIFAESHVSRHEPQTMKTRQFSCVQAIFALFVFASLQLIGQRNQAHSRSLKTAAPPQHHFPALRRPGLWRRRLLRSEKVSHAPYRPAGCRRNAADGALFRQRRLCAVAVRAHDRQTFRSWVHSLEPAVPS